MGIIKETLYYANFNLPIHYFISLSEIGTLISSNVIFTVPYMILILLYIEYRNYKREKIKSSQIGNSEKKKKIVEVIELCYFILLALTLLAVTAKMIFNLIRSKSYADDLYYLSVIVLFIFSVILVVFQKFFTQYYEAASIKRLGFATMIFLSLIFGSTSFEINETTQGRYTGTIIQTKDSSIYISTKTSYFIGKTDKYIFYFNSKDTSNSIIPVDDVIKFKLKDSVRFEL